jgi:5-methylcytosine-specific restriction endonuclease McrA
MIIRSKGCTKCGETKPLSAFCRDIKAPDQLSWSCKDCLNATSRKWHAANREQVLVRRRANHRRASADPLVRAAAVERTRLWCEQNPDKVRAHRKNGKHIRRSRQRGAMTAAELRAWEACQQKVCHWCAAKCDPYEIDHRVPLSKGGKHEARNLVISCRTCNRRKGARCPLEFAQSLGRLV